MVIKIYNGMLLLIVNLTRMKIALEWKITELEVYGDSQLVINQINDDYQKKDDKLLPYKNMVDSFKKYFVTIKFSQISRIDNKAVDTMATITSMLQLSDDQRQYEFLVERLFSPAYNNRESHTICTLTGSDSPLYGKIYSYLKNDVLPLDLS
jgi:hypothetical protein